MDVNIELALELASRHITSFRESTRLVSWNTTRAYIVDCLTAQDRAMLASSVASLAADLDGADWAADDATFVSDCLAAGLDYQELLAVPLPDRANESSDLTRKEVGDLAELLALMHTLVNEGRDPALIFPKNAMKLYQKVSEPGIDIIALELDLTADTRALAAADRLHLTEVKASGTHSFTALAGDAADSMQATTLVRIQRELRLIRASLLSRGGRLAANRIPRFLLEFRKGSVAIVRHAFLVTEGDAPNPFDADELAAMASRVVLCQLDIRTLRADVFAYRRS